MATPLHRRTCALIGLLWGLWPAVACAEIVWQTWGVLLADWEADRPASEPADLTDEPLELRLDAHRVGGLVGLGGEWEPTPGVLVFAGLDTGLLPVDPLTEPAAVGFVDEARETWLIRSLGVELFADDGQSWSVVIGKQRLVIGGGLLADTVALGADAAFDDGPFALRMGLWWPGRRAVPRGWPIVRGAIEWRPDLFVRLSLFAATTRFDGERGRRLVEPPVRAALRRTAARVVDAWLDGTLELPGLDDAQVTDSEQVIEQLRDCIGLTAEISPSWLGIEAEALLDGHTLRATAVLGGGAGQLGPDIDPACPRLAAFAEQLVPPRRFDLLGGGFDVRWRARLTEWLYTGAFALGVSGQPRGDGLSGIKRFEALIAPAPLLGRPSLMFDGGLGAELGERPAVAYGFEGRGALGGGPTLLVLPHPALELDLLAAPLWTAAETRFYGWEFDADLRWQPLEALVVRGRGAWLWPGGFFPGGGPWYRLALSVEAVLP